MKKHIFILIAVLSVLMASCSQRWCNAKYPQIASHDSTYIETIKEIPVYLPGDSILVNVPINCPDQEIANVETAKLKQQIRILNGKLISNTQIKPDTIFVPVTETKTVIREVKVPVSEKFVPKFVKYLAWIGGIGILIFILWIVLKFVKPKIRLFS